MEIGYESNEGITYVELKSQIEKSLNIEVKGELEYVFVDWFFDSFNSRNFGGQTKRSLMTSILNYTRGTYGIRNHHKDVVEQFFGYTYFMNGSTNKYYLDYLELKEARVQSKRAFYISFVSIAIALISVYLSTNSAEPPFDVTIIGDKTTNTELKEQEIDSLKIELEKADTLINIYEQDLGDIQDKDSAILKKLTQFIKLRDNRNRKEQERIYKYIQELEKNRIFD